MAAHRAASSALASRLAATFGVSDDDLVDEKEVEQIERTTKLIISKLIGVAEDHPTGDTLAILQAVEAGIDSLLGMTPQQARRYLKSLADGEDATMPGISSGNTESNGRPALALGNAPSNPLVDRFNALDPIRAELALQIGESARTPGDQLVATTIGYLLDPGNRDWKVVDDGNGQPVLASVQSLTQELDNLRRTSRTSRPDSRLNNTLARTLLFINSTRKLQAAVDSESDDRFYDIRSGVDLNELPMGPDPEQVNELERTIRAIQTGR